MSIFAHAAPVARLQLLEPVIRGEGVGRAAFPARPMISRVTGRSASVALDELADRDVALGDPRPP